MFALVVAPLMFLSTLIVWGPGGLTAAGAASTPKKITTCTNLKTGAMRILLKGTCKAKTEKKLIWIQFQDRPSANSTPKSIPTELKCALGGTCKVGDLGPGGGVVFYVADSRQSWGTYLEAAPNSWEGGSSDPTILWCARRNKGINIVTQSSIGSGSSNTTLSIAECPYGAAERARAYRGGGKSDWFLPSRDDLHQLYLNRAKVGGFSENCYWSSTLLSPVDEIAWCEMIGTGIASSTFTFVLSAVRPIRAF